MTEQQAKTGKKRKREEEKTIHQCPICNYKTSHTYYFKQHCNVHTGEKPYSCNFCDHKTAFKSDLYKHLRTHTEHLKIHKCQYCYYCTDIRSNLNKHIRRNHLKIETYTCEFCGYQTAYKHNFENHHNKHLTGKTYRCDICEFTSFNKSRLKRHKERHSPLGSQTSESSLDFDNGLKSIPPFKNLADITLIDSDAINQDFMNLDRLGFDFSADYDIIDDSIGLSIES